MSSAQPFSPPERVNGIRVPYYFEWNEKTGLLELTEINPLGSKGELVKTFCDVETARWWLWKAWRAGRLRQ
jgi:hypothetical protein